MLQKILRIQMSKHLIKRRENGFCVSFSALPSLATTAHQLVVLSVSSRANHHRCVSIMAGRIFRAGEMWSFSTHVVAEFSISHNRVWMEHFSCVSGESTREKCGRRSVGAQSEILTREKRMLIIMGGILSLFHVSQAPLALVEGVRDRSGNNAHKAYT